jgi:4-diphosphocytidyl-2C-methyl-D-erythritol kinase
MASVETLPIQPETSAPVSVTKATPEASVVAPAAPEPVSTTQAVELTPAQPQPAAQSPKAEVETSAPSEAIEVPQAPVATVAKAVEKKTEKKATAPSVKKAEAKPAATSGSGSVQLGAFRSNADAETAWKKLSKLPALAGKKHSVVKADLGSKGVFYRLRANGVDAKSTCAALAGKAPCMAVK